MCVFILLKYNFVSLTFMVGIPVPNIILSLVKGIYPTDLFLSYKQNIE